jgi:hypothetical protein
VAIYLSNLSAVLLLDLGRFLSFLIPYITELHYGVAVKYGLRNEDIWTEVGSFSLKIKP